MSRPIIDNPGGGILIPRPTKGVIGIMASLVIMYVIQMVALRSGGSFIRNLLFLSPQDVYLKGYVWQMLTYGWFHSPGGPGHLLGNMLWLWLFGTQMESWWGQTRFLRAYFIFVALGGALTVLVGLFCETGLLEPLLPGFPETVHIGASGGTLGMTVAWGLTHADRDLNFFLLGRMKGKTFVLLIIAIQLLTALSFSGTSVTAHFGGILGAFVLCRGWWRPSKWQESWRTFRRKNNLKRRKASIERELRILEGSGKKDPPPGWRVIDGGPKDDDPKKWN